MIKTIKENWWVLLFFTLAVIADALMDHILFDLPWDNGFWSLHTEASKIDAWHMTKLLKWLFIVFAIVGKDRLKYHILWVFAAINVLFHELVLKSILRRKP